MNTRRERIYYARLRGAGIRSIGTHLSQLGFDSYQDYIRSQHWQDMRRRFYASGAYKGCCWCCGRRNVPLEIHHRTYKRMGHELISDLVALCRECHRESHDFLRRSDNPRVNIWNSVKKVRRLFRRHSHGVLIPARRPAYNRRNRPRLDTREQPAQPISDNIEYAPTPKAPQPVSERSASAAAPIA